MSDGTVAQRDEFEESLEHAEEHAQAWRFDRDGAVIVGHVVGFGEFDAGWGPYPIVTLRLADGTERAVHCQREVLSQELAKARPRVGERIGVKWLGQPAGKKYHRYVVRIDRPAGSTFDWARYVEGSDIEQQPPGPTAPAAAAGDPGPTPPAAGDEDIPF
jgi:hypothetical protein